jgi:DNA polymerase-3 subunit gamma/tau
MSYQVLARKYRPKSFDTLVGQEHVVRALTHALEQKRLHHAYLFTGTRGVGKTTLSRILAKSLNCESGITAQPCGSCDACIAIDAGRFVDYIEMDAASNRGVDEMAQLLEQAVYAPSNARFKVYMIDEVHMLTNHAFNSMLKTLEEPPEHVKFILATTDPQKIPVTVLSRCLQFNLKQMPPGHIVGHLENILGQEGITFETPALRLLAQGAQGSMRDALSLTDQAIAYAAGKVTLEAVQSMLGALDQSYLIRLLDALAVKDGAGLLAVADEMASRSLSYHSALQDLGTLLHRIALAQTVPSAVPEDLPEHGDVMRLAAVFDAEEVQLFYQIAVLGRNELGLAPDEYAGFSMTLLRMLAFRPDTGAAEKPAAAALAAADNRASAARPAPNARANATVHSAPAATSVSPARAALDAARGVNRPARSGLRPVPANAAAVTILPKVEEPPRAAAVRAADLPLPVGQKKTEAATAPVTPVAAAVAPLEASQPQSVAAQPVSELRWDGDWPQLSAALPVRGVVQQLAHQSELIKCSQEGGQTQFHLRVPVETLCSSGSIDKLAAALSEHFSQAIRVHVEVGAVQQTANAQAMAERAARQREAEQAMQSDPFVQTLMREFGATIVPGSIKPT